MDLFSIHLHIRQFPSGYQHFDCLAAHCYSRLLQSLIPCCASFTFQDRKYCMCCFGPCFCPSFFELFHPVHLVDGIGRSLELEKESHEVWWEEEEVAKVGSASERNLCRC